MRDLGGAEHEDGVELGEVETLAKDVDGADDVEVAGRELLEGAGPGGGGGA